MADLAGFLTARLDEDEQYARDLVGPHGPHDVSGMVSLSGRLLREIEAKREILAEHGPSRRDASRCRVCTSISEAGDAQRFRAPCPTLLYLAAVYDSHPDYDPAW